MKFFTKEILLVLSAALLLSTVSLYAYPSGVSGYTRKGLTPGCTCHTSSANTGVSVAIKGPSTLNTGQTADYTVVLTYSSLTAAGVNIAASSGSLSTTDTRLQIMNSELTQKTKNTGSGSITWSFKYSAPSTAGTATLYATACGVKSAWNNSPDFSITVTKASTLSLISPNGGENWQVGLVKDITWSGAGVDNVKIEYTTDNGTSWNTIIASTPASAN
ncbi:MAG: choice-of-anchor V domain-containing protein, partial [Syntrophothermus sp.]